MFFATKYFCFVLLVYTIARPTSQEKVLINDSEKVIKKKTKITSSITTDIAPGEGKTPTNYMREENFLETAFPRHYPDGNYGLFHPREKNGLCLQSVWQLSLVGRFGGRILGLRAECC